MINITIRDEAGHEYPFAVSNNIADAILELLSALDPARVGLPLKRSNSVNEPGEQPRYKV
jgi:hypothetical protein